MISFKKYNSIENVFDKEFVDNIKLEGFDSVQFVVQEKVHGANFCFVTDGETVSVGKRNGFVEADESFYGHEELLVRYNEKIINLFKRVKEKYPDILTITVFGEMFGGKYMHPDIKNDSRIICIQKGVNYCPNHEFYAFDLYVTTADSGRFLTVDEINTFFEDAQFFYAKTLFKGTIDECLQYPNAFQSHISEWLGLPPIEDNICEGIVIRPSEPIYFHNGARVLLKSKNSRFAEKKSVKKRIKIPTVELSYSENLKELHYVSEEYVTENRLNNVISKIGKVSMPKETGKLIGLFSKDILEDFLKEHSVQYHALEKDEQKILNKHINSEAASLIKKVYSIL
ncbi:MAG: RNA ligase, Rnl2 family [Prevotellaceae bacterium]|jgi:Rnl2 family RNA ligase|nr:RNA ligase, Rnl2 family [Prevotellaceae bacterium]